MLEITLNLKYKELHNSSVCFRQIVPVINQFI